MRVANLDASLAFYGELLGIREIAREGPTARLSASGSPIELLRLTEIADAKPRPPHTTGLFHVAIRVPHRTELANVIRHLQAARWPLHGFANHGVSESAYLSDPDGNGIEIYSDLPPDMWPHEGDRIAMTTDSLDVTALLKFADPHWNGIHKDTIIGHVHLQVSDLKKAKEFYHDLLGFDVVQESYPGALFLSAGGYHHHVAANIWSSRNGKPPPEGSVGLRSFRIVVPDADTVAAIKKRLEEAGVAVNSAEAVGTSGIATRDLDGIGVEIVAVLP